MPTKADIRAVAEILESPDWETPEAAAAAAIEALDARRRDRMTYGVAIQGLPVATVYYGFENREEGIRWCKRIGLDVVGLSVGVIPVFSKDKPLEQHLRMTKEIQAKNQPAPLPGTRGRGRPKKVA